MFCARRLRPLKVGLVLQGVIGIFGLSAWSAPDRQIIPQAISVFITPRGMQYFETHLDDVLFRNGTTLEGGKIGDYSYQAPKPLPLDQLPPDWQVFGTPISELRKILSDWLLDFEWNDPQPAISVKDIAYSLKLGQLGLRIAPDTRRDVPVASEPGVPFLLEAIIPNFGFQTGEISISDLQNPFLGIIHWNSLHVFPAPQSAPLVIQAPFWVTVNRKDGVKVSVQGVTSNLESLQLQSELEGLTLPAVEIHINGKVMHLNPKRAEIEILKKKDQLLNQFLQSGTSLMQTRLAPLLNEKIQHALSSDALTEVNEMDPPGLANPSAADKFQWGVMPTSLRLEGQNLFFGLDAFAEDPRARYVIPLQGGNPMGILPNLSGGDSLGYDLALGIHQSFLNRVLQLSFIRKYFTKLSTGETSSANLVESPRIVLGAGVPPNQVKIHVKLEQEAAGLGSILVTKPVQLDVDAFVRIVKTYTGQIKLVLDRLDEKSLVVDTSSVWLPFLKGTVEGKVKSAIADANLNLKKKEIIIVENLPVPSGLLGLSLKLKDVQSEPKGHLVLFLEYAL